MLTRVMYLYILIRNQCIYAFITFYRLVNVVVRDPSYPATTCSSPYNSYKPEP